MIRIPEHLLVFTKSTFISQPNHLAGEKKKKKKKKRYYLQSRINYFLRIINFFLLLRVF